MGGTRGEPGEYRSRSVLSILRTHKASLLYLLFLCGRVDGQDFFVHDEVQSFGENEPIHGHHSRYRAGGPGELFERSHFRSQYVARSSNQIWRGQNHLSF